MKNHIKFARETITFEPLERRVQPIVRVECSVWRHIMLIEMKITLLANYQFFFYTLRGSELWRCEKHVCSCRLEKLHFFFSYAFACCFVGNARNKEEPANDRARVRGRVSERARRAAHTKWSEYKKAAKEKLQVLKFYKKNYCILYTPRALRPHHICFCFQLRSLFSIFFRLALCSATHSVFDCCCRHRPSPRRSHAILRNDSPESMCMHISVAVFFVQHYKIYLLTLNARASSVNSFFYTFCSHSHSQLKLSLITACSSYCT